MIDLIISAITHRSGSTLLQRICNARKKNLVWGEHQGIIKYFLKIYDKTDYCSQYSIQERKAYFGNQENPNQWIPNLTPEKKYVEKALITSLRTFLDTLYSQYMEDHDFIGFKEVRYGSQELNLLRKCYPDAAMLLLIRNPLDIYKSIPDNWPDYHPIYKFTDIWSQHARDYLNLSQYNQNSHLIFFEDLIQQKEETLNLISKLTGVTLENIKNVLTHKLGSSHHKSITKEDIIYIKEKCQQLMEQLNY